jgi:hypothetical protein
MLPERQDAKVKITVLPFRQSLRIHILSAG